MGEFTGSNYEELGSLEKRLGELAFGQKLQLMGEVGIVVPSSNNVTYSTFLSLCGRIDVHCLELVPRSEPIKRVDDRRATYLFVKTDSERYGGGQLCVTVLGDLKPQSWPERGWSLGANVFYPTDALIRIRPMVQEQAINFCR